MALVFSSKKFVMNFQLAVEGYSVCEIRNCNQNAGCLIQEMYKNNYGSTFQRL